MEDHRKGNFPSRQRGRMSLSLKGSSLLYSLLIAMLISALLCGYLMTNYFQQHRMDRLYWQKIAGDNLQSGLELWLSEPQHWDDFREQSLFETEIDSFIGEQESWGLFGLVHGLGTHGSQRVSGSCLVGEKIPGDRHYSLYLEDRRQPLVLVGKANLQGQLVVPPSGIRTGFIGRRGYERNQLFSGSKRSSERIKPSLSDESAGDSRRILEELYEFPPSSEAFVLQQEFRDQVWNGPVHEVVSAGTLVIRQSSLQGKCRIIAADTLIVEADATLDHSLLYARHILIQPGFQGRLQALALESIFVGEGVQLRYPSALMVSPVDGAGSIRIQPDALVEGAVLLDRAWFQDQPNRDDYLQISPGALIKGLVYADHNLEIQGEVQGQVIAGNFVLRTAGGMYRNHLLDASISLDLLPHEFAAPLLYGKHTYQLVEWLAVSTQ